MFYSISLLLTNVQATEGGGAIKYGNLSGGENPLSPPIAHGWLDDS